MNDKQKQFIDNASYEDLLRKWRHAPLGDEYFVKGVWEYYTDVMQDKKRKLPRGEFVEISKRVGWSGDPVDE